MEVGDLKGVSSAGGGDASAEETKVPPDLLDVVLSWSVEDIYNEEFYKQQVGKIPQKYRSVSPLIMSYIFPLMEEVRENFRTHMETLFDAPYAEIVSIEEAKLHGSLSYYVKVRLWKDEAKNSGRRRYKPMPGDVLILSNVRPKCVSDLNGSGNSYCWASITNVEDVESENYFVVRTPKSIEVENGETNMVAIFLLNISTNYRIWKALGVGYPVAGNIETIRGRWKVLVSDMFRKSFSKLKSSQVKKDLIHMLLRLADGWRTKRFHDLTDSHKLTRIYKFKDLYLVWSVDIIKDINYIQVMKVWDLLPLVEIGSLIRRLNNIFSIYDDSYLEHCRAKQVEGKLEVPISWKLGHEIIRYKELCKVESGKEAYARELNFEDLIENANVNESLFLMKFYSLSSGIVKYLLTAKDGSEIDIPFELTDEEKEIILFPYTSFILGRSGTGKTTILTVKLVQKEQQHCICADGLYARKNDSSKVVSSSHASEANSEKNETNFLKQIFVTVSPKLCFAIRNHIERLIRFASGESYTDRFSSVDMHDYGKDIVFADIPDSFHDLQQKHYPLVITFRKFLMLLDGTLMDSFFEKFNVLSKIPSTGSGVQGSVALQEFIRSKEINYDRFVGSYWPHFKIQLTKQLDPSTVFMEIMSHIKGGVDGVSTLDAKLCKENYLMLSEKRSSTLSRQNRERIYDIFLDYEKKKRSNGEFDLSDLVLDIHRRLRICGSIDHEIDFVYIDEVQDLTMRQIALFKHICTNATNGFIFAGDTAQTIARGVDFRFEDIRSLFYKEFLPECRSQYHQFSKGKAPFMSENKFQLNQNFRTHVGVLNLAQTILDLLQEYFPWSVDKLAPETSWIYGEAPIILESGNEDDAIVTIFGGNETAGSTTCGFGAEQTILVRDEFAKQQILNAVGKQALVLTIVECKGLEFQDVLLYNFFGDSPLKRQWRVIYEYMKDHCVSCSSEMNSFPTFDVAKHSILCSELKHLYVAITRTRQRLWICETTGEYCQAMFDYWKSLGLVQVRHLDSSLAEGMRRASSTEEWSQRGIKFFNEENYEMATMCFERAGDHYRQRWSRAASLRASADHMMSTKFELAQKALKNAAEIYESIGKPDAAAACFITMKDYKTAGMIYMEKCGTSWLKDAGDCLAMARCWSLAADAYAKGKCLSKCLSCCLEGKLFDFGLVLAKQYGEDGLSDRQKQNEIRAIKQSYLESCALHFFELGDIKRMMLFVKAFHSMELIRPFLMSRKLFDELLPMEIELGNYLEAINICRMKGDILLEADMLEKLGDAENSAKLIMLYVIAESLWTRNSKGWPPKEFANKERLLMRAQLLAKKVSCSFHESVCLEAELLSGRVTSLLCMSKYLNDCLGYQNIRLQIFCLRMILDLHLQPEPAEFSWESGEILDMDKHANELMSQNQFSVQTMVHFWNLWKAKILDVLSYLDLHEKVDEKEVSTYEEFCSAYFGVRKEDARKSFVVLNSSASWINDSGGSFMQRNKSLVHMNASRFWSCAQHFLHMELVSVGMRLISRLEALESVSSKKKLALIAQGRVIFCLYEVASFLKDLRFIDRKQCEEKAEKVISSSKTSFFKMVFPHEWTTRMTMDMISLRENSMACKISDEVVRDNLVERWNVLTHGQIGRVVMVLLVTGRLPEELFNRMHMLLLKKQPWKEFIEALKTFLDSGSSKIQVICSFLKAIECTFNANWMSEIDCISPDCFIYLVESLLVIASSCYGKGSCFLTTKASLFEVLTCHSWKGFLDSCAVPDLQFNVSITASLNSIINMVEGLLSSKSGMREWMRKSGCPIQYYRSFVLRLFSILSLAYLNVGCDMNAAARVLLKTDTMSRLPGVLAKNFRRLGFSQIRTRNQYLRIFSEVLWTIGNPLVVVNSTEGSVEFSSLNAIMMNSEKLRNQEDALAILFPKNSEYIQQKVSVHELGDWISTETSHMSIRQEQDTRDIPTKPTIPEGQIQQEEKEKVGDDSGLQAQYIHFLETLESIQFGKCEDDSVVSSDVIDSDQFKLKVEEVLRFLADAVDMLKKGIPVSDRELLGSFLGKLQQLSKALNHERDAGESDSTTARDLCVELQYLKLKLQSLMDSLLLPKNTSGPIECIQSITEEEVDTAKDAVEHSNDDTTAASQKATVKGSKKSRKKGRGKDQTTTTAATDPCPSHLKAEAAARGSSNQNVKGNGSKKSKKKKGKNK